jgi:lipopolysaccharide/colanic/teichoic acid biosynthesis glycosyltransferase
MLKDSPNTDTGTVTLKNDPRVLPIGRFLRKTKINELPQLINVFMGDISLIGPRPQTQRCFDAFPLESQKEIVKVRPGLSGIGSIFFRNEEDMLEQTGSAEDFYDKIIMPYKGKLEEWYVSNQSMKLYFALIISTVFVLVFGKVPFRASLFAEIPSVPSELTEFI